MTSRRETFFLTAAFLAGAALLFLNLNGVVYLSQDEARPFTLLESGQLIYLLSHPFYALTFRQDTVFYLVAFLNLLSLVLFYILCRIALGRKEALWASWVYAVLPYRIEYSRLLFPGSFMEPFFILMILCFWLAASRRDSRWMWGAGVTAACTFLIHGMAYALIAASFAGLLWLGASDRRPFSAREWLSFFLRFTLGFSALFLLAVAVLKYAYQYDYAHYFLQFFHGTAKFRNAFKNEPFDYLAGIFTRVASSPAGGFAAVAMALSIAALVFLFFKKRERGHGFFLILAFTGAGILFGMSCLGFNAVFDRHFVWLVFFFSISAGVAAARLPDLLRGKAKLVPGAVFAVFILVCLWQSSLIVRETFKITDITSFLKKNHVEKKKLLTSWNIYEAGDRGGATLVPLYLSKKDVHADDLWYTHDVKYSIGWPLIYQGYRAGLCEYILTSGIDFRVGMGDKEPMLAHVTPVASWEHPYSAFAHRSFSQPGTDYKIRLYRLSDIFSVKNYLEMKKAR